MIRLSTLSLLLLACGPETTPAGNTELLLTVSFARNDIDELRTSGTALGHDRAFGPFESRGPSVASGCTIDLIFDPADDGSTMVCIEGRAAGAVAASACGTFAIQANALRTGTLHLKDAQPPPDPMSCQDLEACCHNLPADQQPGCETLVQIDDLAVCAARLAQLEQSNVCH